MRNVKLFKGILTPFIFAAAMLLGVITLAVWAAGTTIDLSLEEEDHRIIGIGDYQWLGTVSSGDINGDGFDDLLIGAPDARGAVYAFFGTSAGLSGTTILTSSADLAVYPPPGDVVGFGRVLDSGDLNNDGIDDLIIGADYATYQTNEEGAVYVILGSGTLPTTVDLQIDTADMAVYGADSFDHLGRNIATCDVSGDGIDDLIVGAPQEDTPAGEDAGAVYVITGTETLPISVTAGTSEVHFAMFGAAAGDLLGRAVACGDVNGNGTADIIAGAYHAGTSENPMAGEAYVIYGGPALSSTLDLNSASPDVALHGVAAGDEAGFSVSSGDINGDGTDDILIGTITVSLQSGAAYLVYGGASLSATIPLTSADVTFVAAADADRLSRSLVIGNFNGDLYDDILLGASWADPSEDGSRDRAGISYVVYGAPSLTTTVYVTDSAWVAIEILGDDAGDQTGRRAGSGDLNGDGADEILIGGLGASDPISGTEHGEAYVIYGCAPPTLSITRVNSTTAGLSWTAVPNAAGYRLYRDTTPYFTPSTPYYTTTDQLNFDDAGVLGDVSTNYYYVIESVCQNGIQSGISSRVGEFDYELHATATSDFNWIALPLNGSLNVASDLMRYVESNSSTVVTVTAVARWNVVGQNYVIHLPDGPTESDFDLTIGDAYQLSIDVESGSTVTWTLTGSVPDPSVYSYALLDTAGSDFNWLMLPLDRGSATMASHLAADIEANAHPTTNVPSVSQWNTIAQNYTSYSTSSGSGDFAIFEGFPYLVTVDIVSADSSTWP